MRLFVVRHGQTVLNKKHIRQGADGFLDEQGIQEARLLASRLVNVQPIDIILASPYARAQQTAQIISDATGAPYLTDDALAEVRYPSEIIGKKKDTTFDAEVIETVHALYKHPKFRYSDEEDPEEVIRRVKAAVKGLLAEKNYRNVVLVSHNRLMHALCAYILLGEALTPETYTLLTDALYVDNTGITVLDYNTEDKRWRLIVWNDHSHLPNSL